MADFDFRPAVPWDGLLFSAYGLVTGLGAAGLAPWLLWHRLLVGGLLSLLCGGIISLVCALEACWRVWVKNSRAPNDMRLSGAFFQRVQARLDAV